MSSFHLFSTSLLQTPYSILLLNPKLPSSPVSKKSLKPHKCTRVTKAVYTQNGAVQSPEPTKRGRKKKPTSTTSTEKPKKLQKESVSDIGEEGEGELLEDDDVDFPYEDPPLVCCFGAAQKEFVPQVRVSDNQMHPDIYSQWKMLQWDPPEFVRAPGGPPSNVAIAHARLGGRAAFMGKVGEDEFGEELVLMMNKEKVQTRGVKFDGNARTGHSYMKIMFDGGKMRAETVKESAEDSLLGFELNIAVLKEVNLI